MYYAHSTIAAKKLSKPETNIFELISESEFRNFDLPELISKVGTVSFKLMLIDKSVGPQESGQRAAMQCVMSVDGGGKADRQTCR